MVFKNIGVGKIDGIRIGNGGNLTVTNAVNISLNDKTIENNSMIVPFKFEIGVVGSFFNKTIGGRERNVGGPKIIRSGLGGAPKMGTRRIDGSRFPIVGGAGI